jgi:hypothetical protein
MSAGSRFTVLIAMFLAALGAPLSAQKVTDTVKAKPPVNTCSGPGSGSGIGNPTTRTDKAKATIASARTPLSSTLSVDGEKIALNSAVTSVLFQRIGNTAGPCQKVPGSKSDTSTPSAEGLGLRFTVDTARKRPVPRVP